MIGLRKYTAYPLQFDRNGNCGVGSGEMRKISFADSMTFFAIQTNLNVIM